MSGSRYSPESCRGVRRNAAALVQGDDCVGGGWFHKVCVLGGAHLTTDADENTLYVCPLCVVGRALAPPELRFQDEPWHAKAHKSREEVEEEVVTKMTATAGPDDGSDGSGLTKQDEDKSSSSSGSSSDDEEELEGKR